jgi:hypothetical protein
MVMAQRITPTNLVLYLLTLLMISAYLAIRIQTLHSKTGIEQPVFILSWYYRIRDDIINIYTHSDKDT